jgi:aspartate aminotransferase
MTISKRIASHMEEGVWIRKMFEEGSRLKAQYGEDQVFDFSAGNPSEEPPEVFSRELKRLAENPILGMNRYMSNAGFPEVREMIASSIAHLSGLPFRMEHVIMTVGSSGALNVALKTLLDPGDEVILFSPFFMEYPYYIDNHGGKKVVVPTNSDFLLNLEALEHAITPRTKAIILNSPNNPTGVIYPESQIKELGSLLQRRKDGHGQEIYLISDEPYRKILFDETPFPQIFCHIDNALVAYSHSKDLALAGQRIGYLAISPRCADLDRLLSAAVFANRTLGFVNAPALMQLVVSKLQEVTIDASSYQMRRDLLYDRLSALGFHMVKPKGAFYLFPKSPIEDDMAFIQAASRKRILITPGSGFGCPGFFRIAYSVPQKVIEHSFGTWKELAREFDLSH